MKLRMFRAQFAADAFGPPQAILLCHLLDRSDGLRGEFRTATAVARFELPEEAESLAMPPEERVGLENQKRFFPVFHTGSEEDEPETIRLRKGRLIDTAVEDDQLLPEQGILSDKVGPAVWEGGDGAEHN
jgi:hypothetical protein